MRQRLLDAWSSGRLIEAFLHIIPQLEYDLKIWMYKDVHTHIMDFTHVDFRVGLFQYLQRSIFFCICSE